MNTDRWNRQLTLDGTEVPVLSIRPSKPPPLTPTQHDVLRHIGEHGSIRPVEAGRMLYANQGTPWRDPYASADGSEVLRRLAKRGLVHKEKPGKWVAGLGEPVQLRRSEQQ